MIRNEIDILEGVEIIKDGKRFIVKGKKGQIEKEFFHPDIQIKIEDKKIIITTEIERKKIKALIGTWDSLLKNMMLGVTKGWQAEVTAVYQHFPIKLKIEKNKLHIENFLGEKHPRTVLLPEDVEVKVEKNCITISGVDKEKVGQVAALIEQKTKVKGYDRRVFQDGCYITKKPYLVE